MRAQEYIMHPHPNQGENFSANGWDLMLSHRWLHLKLQALNWHTEVGSYRSLLGVVRRWETSPNA